MLKSVSYYRFTSFSSLAAVVALLAGCGSGGGSGGGPGVLPTAPITQASTPITQASTPVTPVSTPAASIPTSQNSGYPPTQTDIVPARGSATSPPVASTPPVAAIPPAATAPPVAATPPAATAPVVVTPPSAAPPIAVAPASPAASPSPSATGSFDPNYIGDLVNGAASWASLPVKVSFVQDANYTQERQAAATAGFDEWVSASNGVISYQLVPDASSTGTTVRFDPTQANSVTSTTILGSTIISATMSVGVQTPGDSQSQIADADLQVGAAHEMGHALGIEGHSKQLGDLMYFEHIVGVPTFVDQRDLNTIKTIYYSLFAPGRSTKPRPSNPTGSLRVVTIA